MYTCVSTPHFAIHFNGFPGSMFKCLRGLLQGDPLSPFMFTMVIEGLCRMIAKLEYNGLHQGFKVNHHGKEVTHLLFADDTLFFFK